MSAHRKTTMRHQHLILFTLLAIGCDAAADPATPKSSAVAPTDDPTAASADAATGGPKIDAANVEPAAPVATPAPAAKPVVVPAKTETLLDQAGSALAADLGEGLGAANEFFAKPSPAPAASTPSSPSASAPKTPAKDAPAAPKAEPTKPPSGKACDARTYAWTNMRVPVEGGTVKLKKGLHGRNEECYWVSMIGPVIADLDGDGREEVYFVVNETMAAQDLSGEEDAMCLFSQVGASEQLFVYELDEKCAPRKRGQSFGVGDCPDNEECAGQKLQVRGKQVVYGSDRFVWSAGKLTKA